MNINTPWFRVRIGRLSNYSGGPLGVWFGWRPRPEEAFPRFAPLRFTWQFALFVYDPWTRVHYKKPWLVRLRFARG